MRNRKAWIFAGVLAALLVAGHLLGGTSALEGSAPMAFLAAAVREHPLLAAALYCLGTIVGCAALALPGFAFAIAAGLLFGPLWGTLLCWLSVTAGAMLAFLAGRYFLKDALEPQIARNALLKRWLFDRADACAPLMLAVTRLVPVFPYNLQNFAYGATGIRFRTYSLLSFAFLLPGTALYAFAAAGIASEDGRALHLGIAAIIAAAAVAAAGVLKRRAGLDAPASRPPSAQAAGAMRKAGPEKDAGSQGGGR